MAVGSELAQLLEARRRKQEDNVNEEEVTQNESVSSSEIVLPRRNSLCRKTADVIVDVEFE
eukprot:scaffold13935_cov71-Cyclotella_meneghiniana.AAC.6